MHEYVVSTGDTLSSILNQYGIDMGDITQLAAADKELRNLKIGQQLSDINRGRRTAAPHPKCLVVKPEPMTVLPLTVLK